MTVEVPPADDTRAANEAASGRSRFGGYRSAGRRVVEPVAFAVLFLVIFWWWLTLAVQGSPGDWAFDFRQFWQGAHDVVNGDSPYPTSALLETAGDHLGPEGIREVFRFPYPAGALIVLAPLGFLSFHVAAAVWSALLITSVFGALWMLRVTDWRILAVVATSAPVISSVRLGTLTPVLILLLAAAWRWRDRRWVPGLALALAICLKVFLWPVVVWLIATRRFASAIITGVSAAVVTFGAWAAIGFDGLAEYPELVRRLTEIVADRGYSLVALGTELGLPSPLAAALPWMAGVVLLTAVMVSARRADGDRVAFSLAVGAALALTPIVWLHYFALLIVPLALGYPRFAWAWLLMWVFWLLPGQQNDGNLLWIAVAVALTSAIALVGTYRPQRSLAR